MNKTVIYAFPRKRLLPAIVPVLLLLVQCATAGNSASQVVSSRELRDYVCIVNAHLHPNMERYINEEIRKLIESGNTRDDNLAYDLESVKRGGRGSGFVYVDSKGNNFIITNYHVIEGAYRLSVVFENDLGERRIHRNLYVMNVDEQADLAILAFPIGERPFRRGIPLSTAHLRSGDSVGAAGYPGIAGVQVWNYYPGYIGNPRVPHPTLNWVIQHNANINPGNSGGPLLVQDHRSHIGYSIVGINTYFRRGLQGANFAVPVENIEAFLQKSFEYEDEMSAMDSRLAAFMDLLVRSTSSDFVYQELSSFLSSTMINTDPMRITQRIPDNLIAIKEEMKTNPITGIAWAVAYSQIEIPIYSNSRKPLARQVRPQILSRELNNLGGYTVRLLANGYPYRSEWIRDYGTWKLDDFMHDDGEYNDQYQLATAHPLGKDIIYSFSSRLDWDWYTLQIPRPGRLTIRTDGATDPEIRVMYDPETYERPDIGYNDDFQGRGFNAEVSAAVRAGTVYVLARMPNNAAANPGEYVLSAVLD